MDAVLLRLHALGLRNALVEIGGELRGSGQRPDGQPWRVAIAPVPAAVGPAPDAPPQAIALRDCAIATSGSLYHCHQWQGRSDSHTLDPRTGAPIAHALASVTVLHAECLHADALATLLTVLGPEAGWEFAEQHGIAALLSSPTATRCSSAWEAALGQPPSRQPLSPMSDLLTPDPTRWAWALALLLAYALLCLALYQRHRRARLHAQAQAAALASGHRPILIAYASQTGQAQQLAEQCAQPLHAAGWAVTVQALNHTTPAQLQAATHALFIVSTYGEGDAPDNAALFQRQCMAQALDLSALQYSLLALGDRPLPPVLRLWPHAGCVAARPTSPAAARTP